MRLSDFPKLEQWFAGELQEANGDARVRVLRFICQSLSSEATAKRWAEFKRASHTIVDQATQAQNTFIDCELALADLGCSLQNVISAHFEAAVCIESMQDDARAVALRLADATNLDGMRFLSAWVAFNCNDVQGCVDECDKIVTVTSQVNTLQGQAFLELGEFVEAIESFRAAHEQEPRDPLALFQLSKAQLASGCIQDSWLSISKCQKLDQERESLEICTMRGLIALELGDEAATKSVLSDLKVFAERDSRYSINTNGAIATLKLKLAATLSAELEFSQVLMEIDLEVVGKDASFRECLPDIAKSLHQKGWNKASVAFLNAWEDALAVSQLQ